MSSRAWCCSRRRRKRLWRRSWRRAPGERRGRRHALSSRSRVQSAYIPSSNTIPCSCGLRMRDKQSSVRAADAMAIERARVLHYANKQLTHPFSCARRRVRQVWAHLLDQHMICKWLGAERCGHRAKLWLRGRWPPKCSVHLAFRTPGPMRQNRWTDFPRVSGLALLLRCVRDGGRATECFARTGACTALRDVRAVCGDWSCRSSSGSGALWSRGLDTRLQRRASRSPSGARTMLRVQVLS
jgi:hypothetical protein